MSENMIVAKSFVDWLPAGRFYEDEFSCKQSGAVDSVQNDPKQVTNNWRTKRGATENEELYIHENIVIRSSASEDFSTFPCLALSTEHPVIDACWCSFSLQFSYPSDSSGLQISTGHCQSGLAVFESERMTFIDKNGEHYSARLPCCIRSVWSLQSGVLIERQATEAETLAQRNGGTNLSSQPLFTLFSLSHPLDEAAPVLLKVPLPSGRFGTSFVTDVNLRIVASIASRQLLITRHEETGLYSLWQVEAAQPEDYIHLYEVGDDGRACVAPAALSQLTPQANRSSLTPRANQSAMAMPHGHSDVATLGGTWTQERHNANSSLCLSPFAAVLSRFTMNESNANCQARHRTPGYRGKKVSSPSASSRPFSPSSLAVHISRLSNSAVTALQVNTPRSASLLGGGYANSTSPSTMRDTFQAARRRSQMVTTVLLGSTTCNSTATTSSHLRLNTRAQSLIDGQAKSKGLPQTVSASELLDEPLLPKLCLRLVWTEPTTGIRMPPKVGRPLGLDHSWNMATPNRAANIDISTPAGHLATNLLRDMSELSVSSHFRVANKRLMELAHLASPSFSATRTATRGKEHQALEGSPSVAPCVDKMLALSAAAVGPVRIHGFMAEDLAFSCWICFLVNRADSPQSASRLACLPLVSDTDSSSPDVSLAEGFDQHPIGPFLKPPTVRFGQRLTYLPAVDAVYTPASRLTACLEPGTGVVIYTGVQKVGLLGMPPPSMMLSYRPGNACREKAGKTYDGPLIVRPTADDLDRWRRNNARLLLDRVPEIVAGLSGPSPLTKTPSVPASITSAEPALVNCRIAGDTLSGLGDPSDNAFTVRQRHQSPNTGHPETEAFYRVYLPPLTENDFVRRCLFSLRQSLPASVSLPLLTRWYRVANAPGRLSGDEAGEPLTSGLSLTGPPEWVLFADFLLTTCGFTTGQATAGSVSPSCSDQLLSGSSSAAAAESVLSGQLIGKRQRPVSPGPSDDDWMNLLKVTRNADSLFPAGGGETFRPQRTSLPATRDTEVTWNQSIVKHLPSIFISLHLFYEEVKLDRLLFVGASCLAELNTILANHLGLSAYCNYYITDWSNLGLERQPEGQPFAPSSAYVWPVGMPTTAAPCLMSFIVDLMQQKGLLEGGDGADSPVLTTYLHLPGVNDLAATIAGVLLSMVVGEHVLKEELFGKDRLLAIWTSYIRRLPQSSKGPPLPNADPLATAFVEALSSPRPMTRCKSPAPPVNQAAHASAKLSLVFLSRLDDSQRLATTAPSACSSLMQRLLLLPTGLTVLLITLFGLCRQDPPADCSPSIYYLVGRNDLARHCEMLNPPSNKLTTSPTNGDQEMSSSPSLSSSSNSSTPATEPEFGSLSCGHPSRLSSPTSYSNAERWCNTTRPLYEHSVVEIPHLSAAQYQHKMRHFMLHQMEAKPDCQAAFKDDLRLREAYRLLQASSHIHLPRLIEDNSSSFDVSLSGSSLAVGGQTDINARLVEARWEMHLAAAGVRIWAASIGRGMLTLGSLLGSRLPTQLRIPPICLRGRAVSPGSGRRVLVDLAHDSLTGSSAAAAATVATATGANAGRANVAAGDAGGMELPGGARPGGVTRTASGTGGDVGSDTVVVDASNHPGNSLALAIASAVSVSGAGSALRAAQLDIPRMTPRSGGAPNYIHPILNVVANNAVASANSLLSSSTLSHTPAVMASKHWPDFHNGVSMGLAISPHASVDATWIMYNCRSAGGSTPASAAVPAVDQPTAEQAGLLYGLGLNGHLNKLTPYDIGQYLVRVHDLHSMAVLLGLCAGKRGSMDQSVLRLLAVHYRPLLPSEPGQHVNLSVPGLCQAAAVFGLGLLYQGSANRHIANLLIDELGRSLTGVTPKRQEQQLAGGGGSASSFASNSANRGTGAGGDNQYNSPTAGQQQYGNIPSTDNANAGAAGTGSSWSGAGGPGGFAGDNCELICLSAGLALGLVLLQRGDTRCGLSDLPWAERLHAYMTGGRRPVHASPFLTNKAFTASSSIFDGPRLLSQDAVAAAVAVAQLSSTITGFTHGSLSAGPSGVGTNPTEVLNSSGSADAGATRYGPLPHSQEHSAPPAPGGGSGAQTYTSVAGTSSGRGWTRPSVATSLGSDPVTRFINNLPMLDALLDTGLPTDLLVLPIPGSINTNSCLSSTSQALARHRNTARRRLAMLERNLRLPPLDRGMNLNMLQTQGANSSQIRDLDCYNVGVNGPGATMALGMAYLGSGNATISSWLEPPNTMAQFELIRPDLLMFRAIAHGMVHWHSIEPTWAWLQQAYLPAALLLEISEFYEPKTNRTSILDFVDDLLELRDSFVSSGGNMEALVNTCLASSSSADAATLPTTAADTGDNNQPTDADDAENRCPIGGQTLEDLTVASSNVGGGGTSSTSAVNLPTASLSTGDTAGASTSSSGPAGDTIFTRVAKRRRPSVSGQPASGTSARSLHAQQSINNVFKFWTDIVDWKDRVSADKVKVEEEAICMAYLKVLCGRAFVLGLCFAGTSHPGAANLLLDLIHSLLNSTWWPPNRDSCAFIKPFTRRLLPRHSLNEAVAMCLLALSFVVAGSGNLTVLRLARQLRAIRLFRASHQSADRLNTVATVAARAAARAANSTSSTPVSVSAVFGVTLGPSFGIQMLLGSVIGILFLGGGRLTLMNTPEAAAILSIAFLPILPAYSGDNWFHLQALRHLYVLAVRPRRLCAVDVDTGQVVLSNMRAKLRNAETLIQSTDTAVLPTNSLDDLEWLEVNYDSDKYWPTLFYKGTSNWEHIKQALNGAGFFFVKQRHFIQDGDLTSFLSKFEVTNWSDLYSLAQAKLLVAFLTRFPYSPSSCVASPVAETSRFPVSDFGRAISVRVTKKFLAEHDNVKTVLRGYYYHNNRYPETSLGDDGLPRASQESALLAACRLWFSLPDRATLAPFLPKAESQSLRLCNFIEAFQTPTSPRLPKSSVYWLFKLMFTSPVSEKLGELRTSERTTTTTG